MRPRHRLAPLHSIRVRAGRAWRTGGVAVAVLAAACTSDAALAPAPSTPAPLPAAVAHLALTLDLSTSASAAREHATFRGTPGPVALSTPASFASLLGADAIAVEVARVERGALGQYAPGKVRLFVGLRVRNALERAQLLTPTFPEPPSGSGVYLFSLQAVAVESPGGVSVAGNTVVVESPSAGHVVPGPDWEPVPYDYLRGTTTTCGSSGTCARWKRFEAPIAAGGVSEVRTVSYDIDPTVRRVRLRLVVAADVADAPRARGMAPARRVQGTTTCEAMASPSPVTPTAM